jgi:hypothetical protein
MSQENTMMVEKSSENATNPILVVFSKKTMKFKDV